MRAESPASPFGANSDTSHTRQGALSSSTRPPRRRRPPRAPATAPSPAPAPLRAEDLPFWAQCLPEPLLQCLPGAASGGGGGGGGSGSSGASSYGNGYSSGGGVGAYADGGGWSKVRHARVEADRLLAAGHDANNRSDYEEALRCFVRSNELYPRSTARISAANMALKLGDAASATEAYLALLEEGGMAPKEQVIVQRKLRESTAHLSALAGVDTYRRASVAATSERPTREVL